MTEETGNPGPSDGPARVARDARGPRTTFEEIEIGQDLGSLEWTVTESQIDALCESDDDHHEWYSVSSPFGGRVAPVLISYPPIRLLFARKYNVRGLFYELRMEQLQPIIPGQKMTVSGRVVDKWIKRDREYVCYEAVCVDDRGSEVFRTVRTHVLDFIPRTAPRSAVGVDSGFVPSLEQE